MQDPNLGEDKGGLLGPKNDRYKIFCQALRYQNRSKSLVCHYINIDAMGHTKGHSICPFLFVCNRGDTYYSIKAVSREGSLAKTLSLVFLTPRPVLSSHQHRTLVFLFDLKTYTMQTHQQVPLLVRNALSCWMYLTAQTTLSPTHSHSWVPPD